MKRMDITIRHFGLVDIGITKMSQQKIFLLYWRLEILLSMVVGRHGALRLGRQQRLVDVGNHLGGDN